MSINNVKAITNKLKERRDELKEQVDKLDNEISKAYNNINLDEVASLSYSEIKELFQEIRYNLSSENRDKISKIMEEVKTKENPKILGVHYFPILNEINCIPDDLKKRIDNDLREVSFKSKYLLAQLLETYKEEFDFYEELEKELLAKNVIEPVYFFTCPECEEDDDNDIVDYKTLEKMKVYWDKTNNEIETTKEEDEECYYGYIEVAFECDSYEIGSIEEFFEKLTRVEYKMNMKPDLTLEKI